MIIVGIVYCFMQENIMKKNLSSSKSLCLTDITNVTLTKHDEKQQKSKSKHDAFPNDDGYHDDETDVLLKNNCHADCVTSQLSDVHCVTKETLYSGDFVENEKLRLTCNDDIYLFEKNCNLQNCKAVSTDNLSINKNNVDTTVEVTDDLFINKNNLDESDVKSSHENTPNNDTQHLKLVAMVAVRDEQSSVLPVDETRSYNQQPSVPSSGEPRVVHCKHDVSVKIQNNGNSSRSEHASSDKDHKTTSKRKGLSALFVIS